MLNLVLKIANNPIKRFNFAKEIVPATNISQAYSSIPYSNFSIMLLFLFIFSVFKLNAGETHFVDNNNDAGEGSLRQTIGSAQPGDTIRFAGGVDYIKLRGKQSAQTSPITIDKNLIIIGGSGNTRVTIDGDSARVFNVPGGYEVKIYNCSIINALSNSIYVTGAANITTTLSVTNCNFEGNNRAIFAHYCKLTATNCNFENQKNTQTGNSMRGGACSLSYTDFSAINCKFLNNSTSFGGAVHITNGNFTATNCDFIGNNSDSSGTAVYVLANSGNNATFTATNCKFNDNTNKSNAVGNTDANVGIGGAVSIMSDDNSTATFAATGCNFDNNANRAVYIVSSFTTGSAKFTANNCNFANNTANGSGGAIYAIGNDKSSIALNKCDFYDNTANSMGGALSIYHSNFSANNCSFYNNAALQGGAIFSRCNFVATNCSFHNNTANRSGGALSVLLASSSSYLYHCNFEGNSCNNANEGGAIYNDEATLYSYNSIYVNNSEAKNVTPAGQVRGTIKEGDNLIENEQKTITRATVFGDRTLTNGYIIPLPFARNATRLTTSSIKVPSNIAASEIISKLATDQLGTTRATTGKVSYGSVEAAVLQTSKITLTSNPSGATFSGAGNHTIGSKVVLEANFTRGCWKFVNWTDNNNVVVSTENPYQTTITENMTLRANFVPSNNFDIYTGVKGTGGRVSELKVDIVINGIDSTMGGRDTTINGKDTLVGGRDTVLTGREGYDTTILRKADPTTTSVPCKSSTYITATPDVCCKFLHWVDTMGRIVDSANPIKVFARGDVKLWAVFEEGEFDYKLKLAATEGGNITVNNKTNIYDSGAVNIHCATRVTLLEAKSISECYVFKNWTNKDNVIISEQNPWQIVLKSDTMLTANFEVAIQYNLQFDKTEGGDVAITFDTTISGQDYIGTINITTEDTFKINCNFTSLLFTAKPHSPCYRFVNWTDKNGKVIDTAISRRVLVKNDTLLKANFEPKNVNFSISTDTTIGLIARKVDTTITTIVIDTTIDEQTGELIIDTTTTITDTTMYVKMRPSDVLKVYCDSLITIATSVTNSCYRFKNWTGTNNVVISTDTILNVSVIKDTLVRANFEIKQFALIVNTSNGGTVIPWGQTAANCSSSHSIKATPTPSTNSKFTHWSNKNKDTISKENPINVIVISDTVLTANFVDSNGILEDDIYDISVVPNPTDADFSIVFDNTEEQIVSIELIDLSGVKILDIYEGMLSAERHIYNIDKKLISGTYFVKFVIKDKTAIRKVIVN